MSVSISEFKLMLEEILSFGEEKFDQETLERTKWVVLDTLFAIWMGVKSPEIQKYIDEVGVRQKSKEHFVPIIGTRLFTTPMHSCLIHGSAAVCNELDEGNQFAKGHPAAHLFGPAVIAAIEKGSSWGEFIRAFVIGYEAASRLAYASNINDEMHPHGTWGIMGGTITCAILQGKKKQEIIESALLSASLPLATSWEAAVTGMTVRNVYTGIGNLISS